VLCEGSSEPPLSEGDSVVAPFAALEGCTPAFGRVEPTHAAKNASWMGHPAYVADDVAVLPGS